MGLLEVAGATAFCWLRVKRLTDQRRYREAALTFSSTPAGTTMGRNDSEWGQMGVTMMAGTLGWTMEAPAAAAYAVLPVGVDTITPGRDRV